MTIKKKNNKVNEKEHLPVYGVGPICVYFMVILAIIAIVLHFMHYLDNGIIPALSIPLKILGAVLIVLGIVIWCKAVIRDKIDKSILENKLETGGIYAWVRNPIYSAIAMALTGILMLFNNLWLLILPIIFWLDITIMMKFTEEKWLLELYGNEYKEYCKNVNRCIPWFPKK